MPVAELTTRSPSASALSGISARAARRCAGGSTTKNSSSYTGTVRTPGYWVRSPGTSVMTAALHIALAQQLDPVIRVGGHQLQAHPSDRELRNLASAPGRIAAAALANEATRRVSGAAVACRARSCSAAPMAARKASACSSNRRPAGVGWAPAGPRTNRVDPTSRSSAVICCDTAEVVYVSAEAAALSEPQRATSRSTTSLRTSNTVLTLGSPTGTPRVAIRRR